MSGFDVHCLEGTGILVLVFSETAAINGLLVASFVENKIYFLLIASVRTNLFTRVRNFQRDANVWQ